MSKNRVTIAHVARQAGVSTATAGRVLGDYGYTSGSIRDKVRAAASELGYRPNRLARGLITGKTQTIGVVAGDIGSSFYSSAMRGIADVARSHGFGAILTNSDEQLALEQEAVELLVEKQVDGIIVSPCDLADAGHLHRAVELGRPLVQIDRITAGLPADAITVDNRGAAEACVTKLIEAGHTRIGIVAELESSEPDGVELFVRDSALSRPDLRTLYPSWQRLLGYLDAHRNFGIDVDPQLVRKVGTYSIEAARFGSFELLGADGISALFCADGVMSTGAMSAISQRGLSVPDDLSLVCFDDLDWMSFTGTGITTVQQPVYELGSLAAEMMLKRVDGDDFPYRHTVLPAQIIERGSIRAR